MSVEVPVPDAVQTDPAVEERVRVLLRLDRFGRLCMVLYSCNRFGSYSFGSDCSRCDNGGQQEAEGEEVSLRERPRFHDE